MFYAFCNEAPLVGCGSTKESATKDMHAALATYLGSLQKRGELAEMIEDGTIPSMRVSAMGTPTSPPTPITPQQNAWLFSTPELQPA